ncbi:Putative protein [Zobellia galactanivorans]|uniref:Uncharacterized protein n=1 Tax=Zobellia galactanivorans (strain DSM 12802 / CCUG 47099 / CIP 106680 / NCIMB 13871 / Dsij) TaxID=63186 RepID=G0L8X2_ZOBGA|nr:Putative protein [Zobellia galactanivorans]
MLHWIRISRKIDGLRKRGGNYFAPSFRFISF